MYVVQQFKTIQKGMKKKKISYTNTVQYSYG